jgi:AmmeMemoRadiSam system protein B
MSQRLPRLRMELDFMPSPIEDRPGLMIRDPFGFSDATLVVPPALVRVLTHFDGAHDQSSLRDAIYEITGEVRSGELGERLHQALDEAGFLETERFDELRRRVIAGFESSAVREPSHAGSAYPDEKEELEGWMAEGMAGDSDGGGGPIVGIAAPHASPDGGWPSYRSAYRALGDWAREKTFVILGTSHYGEPDVFGLTRKEFVTPWGTAQTDTRLVDELARRAPAGVRMEDYCHRIEHSIEFQVVFLQSLFGAGVKVLPVLVGSFGKAIMNGGKPESSATVAAFFDVLGDIRAREAGNLVSVLGVDMAHMGRRYGDDFTATPFAGEMSDVERRDRLRIGRLEAGDGDGFWELVKENRDDLKWCGSAPFYTFLKTGAAVRGQLRQYEHWPIDEQSVVTFAAMTFDHA